MRNMVTKILLSGVIQLAAVGAVHALIFKSPDRHMWDVWCYHHEKTWYLYFLSSSTGGQFDGISVATSKDGVHWQIAGTPVRISDEVNGGLGTRGLGTGYTWKAPTFEQGGKFLANFTVNGRFEGDSSYIRFIESTDLLHWRHLDVEFRADPRWYKEDYRWDCIKSIERPGGGYYGYWTAAPKERLGFGFGETDDGIHWRALPPPAMDWGQRPLPEEVEVGGVEKIGGKYYALLTAFTRRKGKFHVVTFTADRPEGPYHAAAKNFQPLPGLSHCWFPGFFPSPDGMLVAHHSIFRTSGKGKQPVYAAPLKRADVDKEGTLRLAWWCGNEVLKGERRPLHLARRIKNETALPAFLSADMDVRRGTILEGVVDFAAPSATEPSGIVIECDERLAGVIRFLSASATTASTVLSDGGGSIADAIQQIDRELPSKDRVTFRLLLRQGLIELYFDNFLMNVYSLPKSASGRIGFLHNGDGISGLKAWTMTLTDDPAARGVPSAIMRKP